MYDEIYTVKAYMGPDPSLPPKLEERIRMYVTDCTHIGMPRNQQRYLKDIEVYLKTFNINVSRFRNGRPGNLFLIIIHSNSELLSLSIYYFVFI